MKNRLRSEQTISRIKQASAQLFAEQGYNAAGVAEICAAAEVSKGAFYHHFKGKNELFLALLEDWLDELDLQLESIASDPSPFPDKLARMGEMVGRISENYQEQIPILFEFWMQASRDKEVWNAAVAPFQRYQLFFSSLIKAGIKEGHLAAVDPQVGAQALISLGIGLLLQRMLVGRMQAQASTADVDFPLEPDQAGKWSRLIQESIQILINGMKR